MMSLRLGRLPARRPPLRSAWPRRSVRRGTCRVPTQPPSWRWHLRPCWARTTEQEPSPMQRPMPSSSLLTSSAQFLRGPGRRGRHHGHFDSGLLYLRYQRCKVEGCRCRIDFSHAAPSFIGKHSTDLTLKNGEEREEQEVLGDFALSNMKQRSTAEERREMLQFGPVGAICETSASAARKWRSAFSRSAGKSLAEMVIAARDFCPRPLPEKKLAVPRAR